MATSATKPVVIYDGGGEVENQDGSDVQLQRAMQESLATAKSDQVQRDAAMARDVAKEYASMPANLGAPKVVGDY